MKLVLVEDDSKIRSLLRQALELDAHTVHESDSAEHYQQYYGTHKFDLYILDVMLPAQSGYDLCRWLRFQGVKDPILMLTARNGLSDKIEGLESGADDYLTKPFEIAEIRARVRAIARKVQGYPQEIMRVGDLQLDPNNRSARRGEVLLELSKKEYALLEFLVRNKESLVTRGMIAQAVWESGTSLYTNVIDVLLNSLRKKVDPEGSEGLIQTVRGKGFRISGGQPSDVFN